MSPWLACISGGKGTLPLENGYTLTPEKDNRQDSKAVPVISFQAPHVKRGYLAREWAKKLNQLLTLTPPVIKLALLKVKGPVRAVLYRRGPEHRCNIGLRCDDANNEQMENYLKEKDILHMIS